MLVEGSLGRVKQKITAELKHIRFKTSASNNCRETSSKDAFKLRVQNLSEKLGCTTYTAREIVSRNNQIVALESANFLRNVKFCSEHLKLSDLVEFPYVLSLNSSLLQHRYFSLIELGCLNVTACNILRFLQLVKKTPSQLEKEGISFSSDIPSRDFMTFFKQSVSKNEIQSRLKTLYKDGSNLWKIKEAINAEYFSERLDCSLGRAHQLFRSYPPLRLQSIGNTDLLLNVLLGKFGFSIPKVFRIPNLLSLHHENLEYFIAEVPSILGINTLEMANKFPLLLRRPVESVLKVEQILKDFDISSSQLRSCPKVINFTPTTLQQRLETVCNSEDFSFLKPCTKFLWLVFYYNNLDTRLRALKALDIPLCISTFTMSKSSFERHLCVSERRTHIKDVCLYLAQFLNCTEQDVQMKLREYPNFQNSSLKNCRRVIEFLLDSGVTRKQLYNGIGIIFYDIDIVKFYFEDLKNHPEVQPFSEWVSHYNLIQLLIYAIEVDIGFRGSHFYASKSRLDDEDYQPLIAFGQAS